jgi:hypothetical protein
MQKNFHLFLAVTYNDKGGREKRESYGRYSYFKLILTNRPYPNMYLMTKCLLKLVVLIRKNSHEVIRVINH